MKTTTHHLAGSNVGNPQRPLNLLFLFLVLGCALGLAQNQNNLVVFSETGDRFYLILNGLKYNQSPETNVKVTGLNATNYKAKIIFEKVVGDLNSNVYLMWEGAAVTNKEFTYAIVKKGDKHKLKLISQADIGSVNANATNSVVYNASGTATNSTVNSSTTTDGNSNAVNTNVNAGGGAYNSNTTITTTTTNTNNPQGGNVGVNMNVDGVSMSINVNAGGTGMNTNAGTNTSTTTTTTSYTTTSTSYNSGAASQNNSSATYNSSVNTNGAIQNNTTVSTPAPGNTNGNTCSAAMSDAGFKDLLESMNSKSFEDAKMKVAKQGISANCVSTAQVKKLMEQFSFEENKLEISKYCYDYTIDKNNYFKVNDGFSFDSSVDTLNDYISQKK